MSGFVEVRAGGVLLELVRPTEQLVIFALYLAEPVVHAIPRDRPRYERTRCGVELWHRVYDAELGRNVIAGERGHFLPARLVNLENVRPCRRCFA